MLSTVVPAVTSEHIRYYETVLADAQETLLKPVRELLGNPEKIEFYHQGYSRAHAVGHMPDNAMLNMAYLPNYESSSELDRLVDFFDDSVVPPRLRVVPDGFGPEVARRLTRARLIQTRFSTVMHGVPQVSQEPMFPEIDIVLADKKEIFEESLRILHCSQGLDDKQVQDMVSMSRTWMGLEPYRFYLALVHDHPAASAMLYLHDGAAYLAYSATLPELRGLGCHRALLQRRLLDAALAGAEIVLATAQFESAERFNLEVMGLSTAYLCAIWERL